MNRTIAVEMWREVCGSDLVMTLPPTGRLLEAFAAKIEAMTREACAQVCEDAIGNIADTPLSDCARAIRAS
jgi:hypothetical protein